MALLRDLLLVHAYVSSGPRCGFIFAFVTINLVNQDHSFGETPNMSFGTISVSVLHAVQLCAFLSARVSK
jgi:hypothetical protein